MRSFLCLATLAGLAFVSACDATDPSSSPSGNGFDFYVLSLSWSPSYCEVEGDRANHQQCGTERKFGFVVHGLWPQFEKGYPEFCSDDPGRVDARIEDGFLDIMPSRGLIRHQWKKHGTCAGLSQTHYFETLRAAHERVRFPQIGPSDGSYQTVSPRDVEDAFLTSNPGLEREHFAVTCDDRRLREVRICMTVDLKYRSCPEVTKRSCRRLKIVMPPSRSGQG